jgi:hypothetical protein
MIIKKGTTSRVEKGTTWLLRKAPEGHGNGPVSIAERSNDFILQPGGRNIPCRWRKPA